MWNPLKILMGMLTPYVEPPKSERIEPTIGESIPRPPHPDEAKQVSAKFYDGTSPGESFKPLTGDELIQIAAIEITEEMVLTEEKKKEARRNSQNVRKRRSRKNRDSGSRQSHGHDEGPSCKPSDSGGNRCFGDD